MTHGLPQALVLLSNFCCLALADAVVHTSKVKHKHKYKHRHKEWKSCYFLMLAFELYIFGVKTSCLSLLIVLDFRLV